MGQVLSQPISNQLIQRRGSQHFTVTSSEMQGFRMNMEDTHTIALSLGGKHPDLALFGVYDGHAGDRASIYLEKHLASRIADVEDPTDPEQLKKAVVAFDQEFTAMEACREDGSTCTFAVVRTVQKKGGKKVFEITVANVGDSRIMIIRADGSIVSLTTDHKPESPEESRRIVEAGGMVQMNRVDGQLAMSRAIGDWQYKSNPNLSVDKQKVIPLPDITKAEAEEGDILLLCCDGIVEQMSNEEAADCVYTHLKNGDDHATTLGALFQLSLDKGSKDNHSAMIVAFQDGREYHTTEDEFKAGPFHPYQNDKSFVKAYLADAKKHGYEGEKLMEMARATEEAMNLPDHPIENPQMAETKKGKRRRKRKTRQTDIGLSAFLPPNAPPELRAMFASMLSQAEIMDDEEDEDSGRRSFGDEDDEEEDGSSGGKIEVVDDVEDEVKSSSSSSSSSSSGANAGKKNQKPASSSAAPSAAAGEKKAGTAGKKKVKKGNKKRKANKKK